MSAVTAVVALLATGLPGGFAPHKTADEDTVNLPHDPSKIYIFHTRVTTTYTPDRFVIVTGGDGKRLDETYNGAIDQKRNDVRLTISACLPENSTGSPGPMAEWLSEKVEDVLTGARPVIAGKTCSRLQHVYSRFMGADEGLVGLLSAYYVTDFRFTTI